MSEANSRVEHDDPFGRLRRIGLEVDRAVEQAKRVREEIGSALVEIAFPYPLKPSPAK